MKLKSHAKLNLTLDIHAKLKNGLHDIQSNVSLLNLHDEIYVNNELIEAQQFKAGDTYSRKVQIPFKIVVGNADSLKGTYNGEMIDFSTDNDSLYGVKTVLFDDE